MFSTAQKSDDVYRYLQTRRSCPLKLMGDMAPSKQEIEDILSVASRVPDHGKLFPWHFIVFEGDKRKDIGDILKEAYLLEEPDATEAKLELEAERFLRAPLVILVVSRVRPAKKPVWEQILSSGAACYNLCLAANTRGYGTNWLSEWYSFNPLFKEKIGLDARDHIAGAIYIGNVESMPEERPRPVLDKIVSYWQPGVSLNKGDDYDPEKPSNPTKGFTFPEDFR